MRTGLRIRYPANRENIREFSEFLFNIRVSVRNPKRQFVQSVTLKIPYSAEQGI